MEFLYCYEDDTPLFDIFLTEDGVAINLTACTVTINIEGLGIEDEPCSIITAATGHIAYQLGEGVAVAGTYKVTFTVTDGTEVRTSPTPKSLTLIVREK